MASQALNFKHLVSIQPRVREMYACAVDLHDKISFGDAVAVDGGVSLNPVAGVLSLSVPSSLAAAVAPLREPVPSIPECLLHIMDIVDRRSKSKATTIPPELLASLLLYSLDDLLRTGCKFYQRLNAALRTRIRDNAKPYFGYLRMLVDALGHLPSRSGTVYRGIGGIDLTDKFPIDKPVRVWEVMSVSLNKHVAENFASFGLHPTQTILVIETPSVHLFGSLSLSPAEEECLFLPGSAFVATKAERVAIEGGRTRAVIYLTHRPEDVTVLYK
jgi:hypothetical protein